MKLSGNASARPELIAPQPHQGRCLRLLSFNIQTGITTKHYRQYLTQSWRHVLPFAKRSGNLDTIANLASDYDLVGLQEVDAGSLRSGYVNQTEYLAARGQFPYWYDQTNRRLGHLAQHSIGILSRLQPSAIREHKLPGRIPGRRSGVRPRTCVAVRDDDDRGGVRPRRGRTHPFRLRRRSSEGDDPDDGAASRSSSARCSRNGTNAAANSPIGSTTRLDDVPT